MIILTDLRKFHRYAQGTLVEKPQSKVIHFQKLSTLISNSNFVRQSFYEYRFESGINIFSLRFL